MFEYCTFIYILALVWKMFFFSHIFKPAPPPKPIPNKIQAKTFQIWPMLNNNITTQFVFMLSLWRVRMLQQILRFYNSPTIVDSFNISQQIFMSSYFQIENFNTTTEHVSTTTHFNVQHLPYCQCFCWCNLLLVSFVCIYFIIIFNVLVEVTNMFDRYFSRNKAVICTVSSLWHDSVSGV